MKFIIEILRSLALCLAEHSHLEPPVIALRKAHRLFDLSTLAGVEVFYFVVPQTKILKFVKFDYEDFHPRLL